MKRVCRILFLFLSSISTSYAQLSTASINGVVTDATGEMVARAEIALHNEQTGVVRHTVSNDAGVYAFVDVPPGEYTLQATHPGFNVARIAAFTLRVNQTVTLNVTLQVGSVNQSVDVTATGVEVESSTSELGTAVSQKAVVDLPLNGRNYTQLLTLTPGVAPVSVAQNSTGGMQAPVGSFTFPSVNGQNNRSNFFILDGIIDQGSYRSTYAVAPIVDDIQEFKINSHNDQAEFGGALGGIINVVTKSGTNDLHGSLWEYIRNDAFDARNFFLARVTPFRQNQFGITTGGPVVLPRIYNGKNKTFFFLGYQGYRFTSASSSFYNVPTAANLNGDFSNVPNQLFNPFTTRPDPNKPGSFLRDPFVNNQIPVSLMNPGMLYYAKNTLPAGVSTSLAAFNALDTTPVVNTDHEYTARIDQAIGEKNFLWFRVSGSTQNITQSGGRPELGSNAQHLAQNTGFSWVRTFGPSKVLQAQFGRTTMTDNTVIRFHSLPSGFIQNAGLSDQFAGNFIGNLSIVPTMNVPTYFSGGESDGLYNPVTITQGKANYSWIIGAHTIKFGGEINSNGFEQTQHSLNDTFNTVQTANPESLGNTGNALASFLLGLPDSAQRRNVHETERWGGEMGFYLQDQWKATGRLTVNVGLRYDRTFIPPYGKQDTIGQPGSPETGSLDLNDGIYLLQQVPPSCAQRGHAPCIPTPDGSLPAHVQVDPRGKIYYDTTLNFQPRVGLAYRVSSRTAIRSGFGIFFDNWAAVTQNAQNYAGAWPDVALLTANNLNNPSATNPLPTIQAGLPFPGGLYPAPTPFTQVQYYMDPHARNPYSMQWNFGVEHQFGNLNLLSVNYVGSGSRRLDTGLYYNVALTPGPGTPQSRSPYPYITPTHYDWSWGRSDYEALQAQWTRRFSGGLTYMLSYTWSKSIDIACSGWYGVEGCSNQDPYHFNNDRSVSGFDLPQVFTANWNYELPVGAGKRFSTGNRIVDYVVGNWQINGIVILRSGIPYNLSVNGDIANTGNASGYERPNLTGDPSATAATPARWFNTAAFAPPAQYTFGNLGRYALRSDWMKNLDFSVFRQFPLSEHARLEFRAEAFNLTNSVTFGTPGTTLGTSTFGVVSSTASNPRQLQFSAKVLF